MTDESISESGARNLPKLGEDEDTPTDRRIIRPSSTTARQVADFASLVTDLGKEYGVSAGKVDRLEADERRVYLKKLRKNARETLALMAKIVDTIR